MIWMTGEQLRQQLAVTNSHHVSQYGYGVQVLAQELHLLDVFESIKGKFVFRGLDLPASLSQAF